MNQTASHIIISGNVQGVFFRKYAKQKADELKLTGWVKNTEEGNVELFAQGDENKIAALIQWCHRGSPKSKVEHVEVKQANADRTLTHFLIER